MCVGTVWRSREGGEDLREPAPRRTRLLNELVNSFSFHSSQKFSHEMPHTLLRFFSLYFFIFFSSSLPLLLLLLLFLLFRRSFHYGGPIIKTYKKIRSVCTKFGEPLVWTEDSCG